MITAKELREATLRGEGPLAKAHDDEPVFLLRAQDAHASDLVDMWVTWVRLQPDHPKTKLGEARTIAESMRRWPIHKYPD